MKNRIGLLLLMVLLSACASVKDPGLVKYETYSAEIDQKAVHGEMTQIEADNLKMQAYQEYQAERRRADQELLNDSFARQIKSQNQDINSTLRQAQQQK